MNKKGVVINLQQQPHYADHLAPISALMNIPMLFVDPVEEAACRRFYPDISTLLIDYNDFTPEYLLANYDVTFMSDLWDRATMREKFAPLEGRYGKRMRNVHVPHGFSDKGYYLLKAAREDIALVYGQNMLDLIAHEGFAHELQSYVRCGNYRYTYYKQHEAHLDALAEKEVFSCFDRERPTIIYAPTWVDSEQASSFFDSSDELLANLPEHYNLIVKLHPRLELDDTINFYRITGRWSEKRNILFVSNFPAIYPLLKRCDAYIGDMSSIGYDFLIFNRPMFFLNREGRNPRQDRRAFLYHCGIPLAPGEYSRIYSLMQQEDKARFSEVRYKMYLYTFGEERPFPELKNDIIKAYSTAPTDG